MRGAVQVFEHQRLQVGARCRTSRGGEIVFSREHFEALTRYADRHRPPPFEIRHRAVVFKQYVGVIQVGGLTIEILPKADRELVSAESEPALWRDVLLQLLRLCPQVGFSALQRAELRVEPADLLELYVARFLSEVERLLREGLARSYRTVEQNRTTFCGRLLVAENLRQNLAHAERVYVATHELAPDRIENRILRQALGVLGGLRIHTSLAERVQWILREFPMVSSQAVSIDDFARLAPGRHTDRYGDALALARLILLHYCPAPRAGAVDTLALLLDMNRLFQGFVLAVLRRAAPSGWSVDGSAHADFWPEGTTEPKRLLPDLVLRRDGKPELVIDTKWKLSDGQWPSDADLRQVFAYGEYFRAPRVVLLYPARRDQAAGRTGRFLDRELHGEIHHLRLFPNDGTKEKFDAERIGERLWQQLFPRSAAV